MSDNDLNLLDNNFNQLEEDIVNITDLNDQAPLNNTDSTGNSFSSSVVEETNLGSTIPDKGLPVEEASECSAPEVNCLALTVKKDYTLSIFKNKIKRAIKGSWRIAVSIFVLNFLSSFF